MRENSDEKIFQKIATIPYLKTKNILEIGCGNGRITRLLSKISKNIYALDPDQKSIHQAKTDNKGINFIVGSGEKLAFKSNYFDLIIFTLSLHHQNSDLALKEAQRVLNKEGDILVIEPLIQGEIEQICDLVQKESPEKKKAQKAIKKSGLSIDRSETFSAQWFFEDEFDLYQWLESYYQTKISEKVRSKIADIPINISKKPIIVQDLMIMQLLTTRN